MVNYIWLGMIVVGVLVAPETLRRGAQKAREAGGGLPGSGPAQRGPGLLEVNISIVAEQDFSAIFAGFELFRGLTSEKSCFATLMMLTVQCSPVAALPF
ncbi:hypothetical protein IT084_03510 [Desulfallas sp. Bu1-1]|uniref:hypothetical protein n=1 Tax=Desulfallas sp. Bu1-1 TaxID=2787620 RepID=UPI00189DFEC0|nr:hypothetical protein [Desulfallas sp. Bu1-1]MBF7082042.1 hypothetical protein [Desulfallas sp. Bu1-1]